MLKQISLLILCAAAIVWFATPVQACTSAVVSGKVTPDGRPLLWKTVIQTLCGTILIM